MKLTSFLLLFLFIPFITDAQQIPQANIDTLANDFVQYLISFDKEKILLQTDRHIYASGETIYFKAFLIDSITNRLRSKPKKIYVDLVNKRDSLFGQLLLNTSNLRASGEFVLSDSLQEGYYWLRAYTEKMASDDLNDITVVPIYVVSAYRGNMGNELPEKGTIDSATSPVIQIFPEGGSIVSGINSTIVLKATDGHGNPMAIRGIVKDNADSVYAKFTTNSEGLSKVSLKPIWYHRYSILVLNKNNKYDSVAVLPPINFFAGQLAILEQSDSQVKVRVVVEDSLYKKDYTTYLLAVSGGRICYSAIGRGIYVAQIPLNHFSHGISRLLLFNRKYQLLSERDIFIKKENYTISIKPDKDNYGARENVKVDVTLTDENNKPLLATLTFAVTDLRVSDTMIHSCMKDTLECLSAEEADMVMLTRKNKSAFLNSPDTLTRLEPFNNSEKIYGKTPSNETYYNSSFTISGTVFNKKNEPSAKKLITIFSNQNYNLVISDTTDVNGKFTFYVPDYSDSTQFVVQVGNLKGKKEDGYKIVYDTVYVPHFKTPSHLKKKFTVDEKLQMIINELYHFDSVRISTGKEWLKPVIINRRKQKKVNYDETKRVSPYSQVITPEMIGQGANRAGDALLMIPGVHSTGNSISIGGPIDIYGSMQQPLVVLNGIAMDQNTLKGKALLDFINSIPVNTIDFIEVLTGPEAAIYGLEGGNGVILIHTTSRLRKNETHPIGLPSFYPKGFHKARYFMMPDYNNQETKNSNMPDLRTTTIYWNANIITNLEGKASFNFFTADKPATYLITITGITANGDKIYKTTTINRK
jgi:hypothetical protein